MEKFINPPKTDEEILKELQKEVGEKYPKVIFNLLQPEQDGSHSLSLQGKPENPITTDALDFIVEKIVKTNVSHLQIFHPDNLPDFKVLAKSKSLKKLYIANLPFSFSVADEPGMEALLLLLKDRAYKFTNKYGEEKEGKGKVTFEDLENSGFEIRDAADYENLEVILSDY